MGRTTFHKGRSETTKQWFERHLTQDLHDTSSRQEGQTYHDCPLVAKDECLLSSVGLHVGYAAVRRTWLPGTGHAKAGQSYVYAVVYLFEHYTKKHGPMKDWGHDFGYKDMDETEGPNESRCPARILGLLSPTDNEYALHWRQRCLDNLAGKVPVKKGQAVRFARPIRFGNGQELQELAWSGSGGLFFGPCGGRYRISGWRKMKYEAVPQGAAAKEAA